MNKNKKIALSLFLASAIIVGTGILTTSSSLAAEGQNWKGLRNGFQKSLEEKAEILGLDLEELKIQLKDGKKFKDILEEQGIERGEFQKQLREQIRQKLQEKGLSPEDIENKLNQFQERREAKKAKMEQMKNSKLENAAQILGVTVEDLKAELQDGQKLFEIVEETGLSKEEFHNQMMELMQEDLVNIWEENGMSNEEIQEKLENWEEKRFGVKPGLGIPRAGRCNNPKGF